jgi:hypothetical protein
VIDAGRLSRWITTTGTWVAKSCALIQREAGRATSPEERWLVGYDAERLLSKLLYEAGLLVPSVNEDQLEDVTRYARELASALRDRRIAGKLENVEGRTAPEAEAFRARAAKLRERSRS